MINFFKPICKNLNGIIKESLIIALPLYRIMIPMIIVVKILKEIGAVEILGQWLAPMMAIVGLPGNMGLVWAATLLGGFFPGIIIFADLAASEILSVRQVTVLSSLMLIAHSFPIELQIADRAGARWLSMGLIRFGGALLYGMILNQLLIWGNWLTERSILLWYPQSGGIDLQTWAYEQLKGLVLMFIVLFLLLQLMKLRDVLGLNRFLELIFQPLLSKIGIGKEATNITVIGMTLGIAYGGGIIIRESSLGKISSRDIFFSMVLMGFFHSVIEDTLLILLLGGNLWGILVGRMIFAFFVVWLIVRLFSLISEKKIQSFFFKPESSCRLRKITDNTV